MTENEKVSLKEHIESRFEDCNRCHDIRIAAIEKAIDLAAEQLDARLATMNEFRASLRDQSATFVPRNEWEKTVEVIEKGHNIRISALELSRAELAGKASQGSVNIALLISIFAVLTSVVGVVVRILRDSGAGIAH